MRLTLRTLLAYLDDILDPVDARELGKKIEDSEFASALVHRIRSVTRKLRLGAPKLTGKGMGLDANTVAEYLDNTLPQERVPDFERICLESDVQLAEVAACHQILTLVLGEPAEVDPALRERIRALQAQLEDAEWAEQHETEQYETEQDGAAQDETEQSVAPPVPMLPAADEPASVWEVPVELPVVSASAAPAAAPGRTMRLLPVLGTMVVAFLLALVALIAIGPMDHTHPILGRFFAAPAAAPRTSLADATTEAGTVPQDFPTDAAEAGITGSPDTPDRPAGATPAPDAEASAAAVLAADGQLPAVDIDNAPAASEPATPDAAPGAGLQPVDPAGSAAPTAMNDPALTRSNLPPDSAEDEEPEPPVPLAQCTSDLHVLARFDAESQTWLRVAAHDPLGADIRLVALPTYRPAILFSSGVQLTVVGPAEVRLTDVDADGVPGVVVQYGRLIVMPTDEPGSQLNIQFGARQSRVTFQDLDATLVLDAWQYLAPGVDPQQQKANGVLNALTPVGRLAWQDRGTAAPIVLEPGLLATMIDTGTPALQPLMETPQWLDANAEPPINQAASRQLEPALDPSQPLIGALREQVNNRLVEVRMLAIRSLSMFDDFDPFVAAIGARELRSYWKDLVESVRAAQARSPETAQQVRASLQRLRGEEGIQLDRLLWRFSPEQLADGDAQKLVEALSSPSMDIRVLAYLNLNEITGKTNRFQPDREPRTQRAAIMSWERDLRRNEIQYGTPPPGTGEPPAPPDEGGQPPVGVDTPEGSGSNVP